MYAGEIVGILHARAACLPGSRDREGRPLIVVHIPTEMQPWTKDNIDLTLRYFSSIFNAETRRNGVMVLVDGQKSTWRLTRACIRHIGLSLGPDLASLIVLRTDAFWDKQRVDNCTKIHKEGEPIYIPISRLHKYVDSAQLIKELGGTWPYNHIQWIQNRLYIENYIKEVKSVLADLDNFRQKITESCTGTGSVTLPDSCVISKFGFESHKVAAQKVYLGGRNLLAQIERIDKTCQRCNQNGYRTPQDTLDTKERIEDSLELMEQKREAMEKAWSDMEKQWIDAREITLLETRVSMVTKWILGTAEKMLNSQREVGYDVPSSEDLRAEHEALELQCRETYGQYAELLHKIDTLPQLNIKIPEDLKSQRDFMDFVCRSFATRLERRRNILITCLRFYRLVTEYFERTSEVFETLILPSNIDSLESADCSLQELQENQASIDELAKELVREGEKLSDMLSMPVKDALGRDVDVNYENDIVNVQEILEATISRKQLFSNSVDLQKLTLEQVTHIHVYEKDAKQAVQWLNDLFQVMMKEYVYVGCNVNEIQMMKEEQQAFQETAKGTYEYGCQLLNAALALRHSCKLSDEYNNELTKHLCEAWHRVHTAGQEQMTRLRVSAVFHRNVEEHCKQLRELMLAAQAVYQLNEPGKKRSKMRKCLHTRERLLLEVGRMVRLGRLLRTRLREPVCPEQHGSENDHMISIDAISEKLAEVTNLAEQLDVALCKAQDDGVSSGSGVSPNIKKILDGTASATTEDWYNNLKLTVHKTPNTSSDSKSEDEFVTASECTCTPPSRSSSFQTASEGGAISPWWEIDPASDSEDKTKQEGTAHAKAIAFTGSESLSEIVVRDVTETTNLRMTSGGRSGISSFLLENSSSCFLRPDMTPGGTPNSQRTAAQEDSTANEIVRQLSEIVRNNESYAALMDEPDKPDDGETPKSGSPSEYRNDGDASSQYSSDLLNAGLSPVHCLGACSSYELDKPALSQRFTTDPGTPEFGAGDRSAAENHKIRKDMPHQCQRTNGGDASKIYIIDTTTPSPKSKRYLDAPVVDVAIRKVVEAEVHQRDGSGKKAADVNHNELTDRMKEVRDRRRPVTTIDLQGACLSPDHYYQTQFTKTAIKGIF